MMKLRKVGTSIESFFKYFMPKIGNAVEPGQLDKDKFESLASSPNKLGTLFAALVNNEELVLSLLVKEAITKRNYPDPFNDGNCVHACPMLLLHLWMYEHAMIQDTDVLKLLDKSPTVRDYAGPGLHFLVIAFLISRMFGRRCPEFNKDLYGYTPSKNAPIMNTVGLRTLVRIMSSMTPGLRKLHAGKRFIAFGDIISTLENHGESSLTYIFVLDFPIDGSAPVLNQIDLTTPLNQSDVILFWPNQSEIAAAEVEE